MKDVELDATIVEGATGLSMIWHESVIMNECDGMMGEERGVVVLLGSF